MMTLALTLAFGSFSAHGLDNTMGSCRFQSEIVDDLFSGTLYQCRWADESDCGSGRQLNYSRGRAKIGNTDYEAESGSLCVPSVGAMPKMAGTIFWRSAKKTFEVKFELSAELVTDRVIKAGFSVEVNVVVNLRR